MPHVYVTGILDGTYRQTVFWTVNTQKQCILGIISLILFKTTDYLEFKINVIKKREKNILIKTTNRRLYFILNQYYSLQDFPRMPGAPN